MWFNLIVGSQRCLLRTLRRCRFLSFSLIDWLTSTTSLSCLPRFEYTFLVLLFLLLGILFSFPDPEADDVFVLQMLCLWRCRVSDGVFVALVLCLWRFRESDGVFVVPLFFLWRFRVSDGAFVGLMLCLWRFRVSDGVFVFLLVLLWRCRVFDGVIVFLLRSL